jgi:DNA-binding NarL/FixJ family response regulator
MAPLNLPPLPLPLKQWNQIAKQLELSPQQKRIVELILRNACDKQIAASLGRGKPTIRTHLDRIFRRLNVDDRGDLVLLIFRMSHGLCSST